MPDIAGRNGPKYRVIADAIIDAVKGGDLTGGEKLPPQRNLAYDLGVTLGTVTRAYQEVERAGIARGEVGRGTFIVPLDARIAANDMRPTSRFSAQPPTFDPARMPVDNLYSFLDPRKEGFELAANYPHLEGTAEIVADSMRRAARTDFLSVGLQYNADNGMRHHRAASIQWMLQFGIEAAAEDVLLTPGAQAAIQTSLIALTRPGDTILAECLTWPGLKATAAPLGLNLHGVEMDEHGLNPDAFEQACRDHAPKAAYILATLHNPTTGIMPDERRRKIAEIAERYDVYLIEDDVYGFLLDDGPAPLFAHTPRLGVYITSLSKAVAPGLRIGYTVVPDGLMPKFIGAMRTSVLMTSTISAEIATDLIHSGAAATLVDRQRIEIRDRQILVGKRLGNLGLRRHPSSPHCWMPVPNGFQDEHSFRGQLLEMGVSVTPGSVFAIDDALPLDRPHIRICLGAEPDRNRLDTALEIIRDIASRDETATHPVV